MSCSFDIQELLNQDNGEFCWNSDCELDNNEAMALFIDVNSLENYIVLNDGTLVYLFNPNNQMVITLESGGKGDMFSHGISWAHTHVTESMDMLDDDMIKTIVEMNGGPITEPCDRCNQSGSGRYEGGRCDYCKGRGEITILK